MIPNDETRLGIAQNRQTGEYAVTIDAIRDGESEVKTYLDAPTARAIARSLNELADKVELQNETRKRMLQ